MNVEIIGTNMEKFKNPISKAKSKYNIQNYWTFYYYANKNVDEQIKLYFDKLQGIRNREDHTINLNECLLVKIDNIFDPEVYLILDNINRLGEIQNIPLVLFLVSNTDNMQLVIDKKYRRIDPRLILVTKYDEYYLEKY